MKQKQNTYQINRQMSSSIQDNIELFLRRHIAYSSVDNKGNVKKWKFEIKYGDFSLHKTLNARSWMAENLAFIPKIMDTIRLSLNKWIIYPLVHIKLSTYFTTSDR